MDFIKNYSSMMSDKSSSDKEQKGKEQDQNKQQAKSQPPVPDTQQIQQQLKQSQLVTQQLQSQQMQQQQLQQSKVGQQQRPNADYQPFDPEKQNKTFNQLLEDSLYGFRKSIAYALEQGINEQLQIEKTALLMKLQQEQEIKKQMQQEIQQLRQDNDRLQLENANYQNTMMKMSVLIAELKSYRKDSLYGMRVIHEWHVIARHGHRMPKYESLMEDQHNLKLTQKSLAAWKFAMLTKKYQELSKDSDSKIKQLHEEREEYFKNERERYETTIESLKKELAGFAVKERKMRETMKQAFLKGINAISQEATCALDKNDRMCLPSKLQQELEDKFIQEGGNVDEVDIMDKGEIDEFTGFQENEEVVTNNYVEVGQKALEQHNVKEIKSSSPAAKLRQHSVENEREVKVAPRPEPKPQYKKQETQSQQVQKQKTSMGQEQGQLVRTVTVQGKADMQGGSLATRLRNTVKAKLDPGSSIYKESVNAINFKVQKE